MAWGTVAHLSGTNPNVDPLVQDVVNLSRVFVTRLGINLEGEKMPGPVVQEFRSLAIGQITLEGADEFVILFSNVLGIKVSVTSPNFIHVPVAKHFAVEGQGASGLVFQHGH